MPLLKQLTFSVDKESCLYQVYMCIVVALNAIEFGRKACFDVNLLMRIFFITEYFNRSRRTVNRVKRVAKNKTYVSWLMLLKTSCCTIVNTVREQRTLAIVAFTLRCTTLFPFFILGKEVHKSYE